MHIVNQSSVAIEHRKSPKGIYEIIRKHISVALGTTRDVGAWGGGHPFEVELARIPPGKKSFPYHSHAAQTEYYAVLAGNGIVKDEAGKDTPIKAGDHFIFLPGEAHQIANDSSADLEYLVIADNHRADVTTYPNTGKRQIKPEMRCIRPVAADYFEGEE
jgi:uncharacterized cupin superfamily protein